MKASKLLIWLLLIACIAAYILPTQTAAIAEIEDRAEYSYRNIEQITDEIEEMRLRMAASHDMAEAARLLGYDDTSYVIQIAKAEYAEAEAAEAEKLKIIEALTTTQEARREEYPAATYIAEYLAGKGLNDAVIAGIIGNFAIETGGGTLALNPEAISPYGYYGLAQWSGKYYPQIKGKNITEQLDFLLETMEKEFNIYGNIVGLTYSQFLKLSNPCEAALAFAKVYERCGTGTYRLRQACAVDAYNYFNG